MLRRALFPLVVLILVCYGLNAQAQQSFSHKTEAEISFVWGYARGGFGDNLDRPLPGFLISIGGRTPNLPLILSTEFGWMSYGYDDRLELLFPNATTRPATSLFNVNTTNSILTAHFVARLVPFEGAIEPFIGGLLGLKYIYSNIDMESQALLNEADGDIIIIGDNDIRTSSNFDAMAVSYGLGAGVNIRFFDGYLGMQDSPTTISLHLGARYLFGSEADYLTENSISVASEGVRFERVESNTDMLIPSLGFRLGF